MIFKPEPAYAMEKSKTILVLLTLAEISGHLSELGRYIRSSTPNNSKLVEALHNWLVKCCTDPNNLEDKLDKRNIFPRVYGPNIPYNYGNLRKTISRYYDLVKDFIVMKGTQGDYFLYNFVLASEFEKLGLDGLFYDTLAKTEDNLPKEEVWNNLAKSLYNNARYYHPKLSTKEKIKHLNSLDEGRKHRKIFDLLEDLKYFCEKLFWNKVYGIELYEGFEEDIDKTLASPYIEECPLAKLFVLSIQLLKNANSNNFENLKISYKDDFDDISSEKGTILTYLLNGLTLFDFGERRTEEFFELYKFGVANQLLVEKGVMEEIQFINIVATACSLNEIDWCEQFIENHLPYLEKSPKNYKYAKALSFAYLNFEKGDFEEALTLLEQVSSQDILYVMKRHTLSLKILCELDNGYLFVDKKRSFLTYLAKKHNSGLISDLNKKRFLNFIDILELIIDYEMKGTVKKEEIYIQLEACEGIIVEKIWLMHKIANLK